MVRCRLTGVGRSQVEEPPTTVGGCRRDPLQGRVATLLSRSSHPAALARRRPAILAWLPAPRSQRRRRTCRGYGVLSRRSDPGAPFGHALATGAGLRPCRARGAWGGDVFAPLPGLLQGMRPWRGMGAMHSGKCRGLVMVVPPGIENPDESEFSPAFLGWHAQSCARLSLCPKTGNVPGQAAGHSGRLPRACGCD